MRRIATLKTIDVVLRDLGGDANRLGEVQDILDAVKKIEAEMGAKSSTAPLEINPPDPLKAGG